MIDVNVNVSRWPLRRLPCDELPALVEKLRGCGVTEAWVGSLDGLLHKDVQAVNARLADDCRNCPDGLLQPLGTVNPTLPDWQEDLRRCHQQFRMPGVRLHPNYHGYRLDDAIFAELLTLAEQRGLMVQLAVRMEDPRTQHPQLRVPDVDVRPLPALIATRPRLRLVLLNGLGVLGADIVSQLIDSGRVYFDLATLEGVGGISRWLDRHRLDRILFGSHTPLFNLEAALLKLRESALSEAQLAAITRQNARQMAIP